MKRGRLDRFDACPVSPPYGLRPFLGVVGGVVIGMVMAISISGLWMYILLGLLIGLAYDLNDWIEEH